MSGYKHNALRREHIRHEVLIVTLPFTELHMQLLGDHHVLCMSALLRPRFERPLYSKWRYIDHNHTANHASSS